jgi:hypothetical protein
VVDIDTGILISLAALATSAVSLYLSWVRFKTERPRVAMAPMLCNYELSATAPNPTDKASLRIAIDVIVHNLGNARASITDIKMRIRYAYSVVIHPMVRDTLDAHVYSARPTNFSEVVPFDLEEYGSKKVALVFQFPPLYPRLLDRAILPIDIRNPKKQDWNDFPIIYQLTLSTPSGAVNYDGVVFRIDQPESKEPSGSLGSWKEWEIDREFSPLEHYKG